MTIFKFKSTPPARALMVFRNSALLLLLFDYALFACMIRQTSFWSFPEPDPSINKQKIKKNLDLNCFVT
jgi:hypothetical protein